MTRAERRAYLVSVMDVTRLPGEPVPIFLDSMLDAMPDLIEDRAMLSRPVPVLHFGPTLDESLFRPEDVNTAQMQLNRKRHEFAKVEMAFEQLREAIRAYHREVLI